MENHKILSIAIPAYDRPKELLHCLESFIEQIEGKFEDDIEIIVSDDCSPNDSLVFVKDIARKYPYIRYHRYENNIGLEKNLLESSDFCSGEFLWIFGDDDFLESKDALDTILNELKLGDVDFLVLNRSRRNFTLDKVLSPNWMNLAPGENISFAGLREFCIRFGLISIIGFISVNVFRRRPFKEVDPSPYWGTMYPQLGVMLEAFHNRKTVLITDPLVCHRTQSREEKIQSLGDKALESTFMSDEKVRNAQYFSFPFVRMIETLRGKNVFLPGDLEQVKENTVINGPYVEFLLRSVIDGITLDRLSVIEDYELAIKCFGELSLTSDQQALFNEIKGLKSMAVSNLSKDKIPDKNSKPDDDSTVVENELTISVISPSYNQAEFLADCLKTVADQSYKPIEHLVFDPGSDDNSCEVAKRFSHVSLIEEADEGQSDAINKGFSMVKGDVIAWVNSDDQYFDSSVFASVIGVFRDNPDVDIVYGNGEYRGGNGEFLRDAYINKNPDSFYHRFQHEVGIMQPATFFRSRILEKIGELRTDLHFCMDYEFWIRAVKENFVFYYLDKKLAVASYHMDNKTYGQRSESYAEVCDMLISHYGYINHIWLKRFAEYIVEGYDGVLKNLHNSGSSKEEEIAEEYKKLLSDYNGGALTCATLTEKRTECGFGDTLREMENLSLMQLVPCEEVALDLDYKPYYVSYTVGKRRWAFKKDWKDSQVKKTHDLFDKLRAEPKSDCCVIVGNGPSLRKTDLSLLRDVDVIISNNAFLSAELYSYAKYYTVVNYHVAEQSSHTINRLEGVLKILPYWLSYSINPSDNTFFVDAVGRPEFSKDIYHNMSWRHTVTFYNMHLAFGLGYKQAIMIGFDHSYKQPKGIIEEEVILSYENDENHFHPNYFKGKKWQAADVDMMEEMYKLAKTAYEEEGREIVNATVDGRLELFRREKLETLIGEKLQSKL